MTVQLVADDLAGASSHDILIGESNHRIANNLTLIAGLLRLQAADLAKAGRPLSAKEACFLLEEVGGRIETVGRLHRILADAGRGEGVDLQRFLRDIAEAAVGSMSLAGDVRLETASSGVRAIPTQQALPIGFIIGELVTNAMKYSHPAGVRGQIELGCHPRPEDAILIQIADDGVGLPENFDPRHDGGLGLRMVRMLADQLGASLTFESSSIGLTVRLLIPPARPISAE
jgi:two-component sensor histidine kinase